MNKQELVEAVAKSLSKSKAEAAKIVEALFAPGGVICSELKKGRKVQITGFGNFETRETEGSHRPQPANRPGDFNQGGSSAGVSGREGAEGTGQQAGTGNRPAPPTCSPPALHRSGLTLGPRAAIDSRGDPVAADRQTVHPPRDFFRVFRRNLHQTIDLPDIDLPDPGSVHPQLAGHRGDEIVRGDFVFLSATDPDPRRGRSHDDRRRRFNLLTGSAPKLVKGGRHLGRIMPLEQGRDRQQRVAQSRRFDGGFDSGAPRRGDRFCRLERTGQPERL